MNDRCLRRVKTTVGTVSAPVEMGVRMPDTPFLCLRPLPCDNPNHEDENDARST